MCKIHEYGGFAEPITNTYNITAKFYKSVKHKSGPATLKVALLPLTVNSLEKLS